MNLANVRLVYVLLCFGLGLIILSSALMSVVALPSGERFSELWILGPNRLPEDYPFNVRENEPYSVFIDVGNHLGSSTYYLLNVKFRNQDEPLPNSTIGLASPVAPLYEYRLFVADNASSEVSLTFLFSRVSFSGGMAFVGDLIVNGVSFPVSEATSWNTEKNGYYFQLFVELWTYSSVSDEFAYSNRFVSRWVNVTGSF